MDKHQTDMDNHNMVAIKRLDNNHYMVHTIVVQAILYTNLVNIQIKK